MDASIPFSFFVGSVSDLREGNLRVIGCRRRARNSKRDSVSAVVSFSGKK
jgi:hypothetical protein